MRLNAVYPRLYFWLGSALVALMDAPPLAPSYSIDPHSETLLRSLSKSQHRETGIAHQDTRHSQLIFRQRSWGRLLC